MVKMKSFSGGVHPVSNKFFTAAKSVEILPAPEKVYIPLSQHIGKPAVPLVKKGDEVKLGEKIGDADGFISAPVHASVSGKVLEIKKLAGYGDCVVIENDFQENWVELVPTGDLQGLEAQTMVEAVKNAGIVGLGGATFPSYVKYMPVEGKKVSQVILNGGECEPFLTADHRIMLEKPQQIIKGLQCMLKMVGAKEGIIGIEDNKMDAVKVLEDKIQELAIKNIRVAVCPEKYPQGAEKQLIYVCTGKEVPGGKLPIDIGVLVNNVGTAAVVAEAIEQKKPLIERIVTVSGPGIKEPKNLLVRLGTPINVLVEACGGYVGHITKLINGGPMMGQALYSDTLPVTKGTSGILAFGEEKNKFPERDCVRCSRCINACPMYLEPTTLMSLSKKKIWEEAKANHVMDCIECGSCAYVCPANIPLVQYFRQAKQIICQK